MAEERWTWGEIRREVEAAGVKDDDVIWLIDLDYNDPLRDLTSIDVSRFPPDDAVAITNPLLKH